MRRAARTGVAALFGVALSGCVPPVIHQPQMAPRLQYTGFSFARPPSASWFIDRSEQTRTEVVVWHDELAGQHHTAFVGFRLYQADFSHDAAGLAEWSKREVMTAKSFLRLRSLVQETLTLQGQTCVSDRVDADVRSARYPDVPLRLLNHSITCIHPAYEKTLVAAIYSERGSPDEVGVDPILAAEGEEILRGFEIDVGPNQPAK